MYNDQFALQFFLKLNQKDWNVELPKNTWFKSQQPQLDESRVRWLMEDEKRGSKYINSYPMNSYSFNEFNVEELSESDMILNAYVDKLDFWWAIENGNRNLSESSSRFVNNNKSLHNNVFKSVLYCPIISDYVQDSSGCIWIAAVKKLYRYDGQKFYMIDIPATSVEIDKENNIWIGTSAYNSVGNLIKFNGKDFRYYNYLNSPIPDNAGISDLTIDNFGNLWMAFIRKKLLGEQESLIIAVFNEKGLKLIPTSSGFSVSSMIYYTLIGNLKFLTYQMQLNASFERLNPDVIFELFSGGRLIYQTTSDDIINSKIIIIVPVVFDQPIKNHFQLYSKDSSGIRNLIADTEIDMRYEEQGFLLGDNEPNPFSSKTKIVFSMEGHEVELKIFDHFIREIDNLFIPKVHRLYTIHYFDGESNQNGIYYYYLKEKYKGILGGKKMLLFDTEKLDSFRTQ